MSRNRVRTKESGPVRKGVRSRQRRTGTDSRVPPGLRSMFRNREGLEEGAFCTIEFTLLRVKEIDTLPRLYYGGNGPVTLLSHSGTDRYTSRSPGCTWFPSHSPSDT